MLILSSYSYAQEESKTKIKFIDGSEFHVMIKENQPGKYVKIQLSNGDEGFINYESILSIKHKKFSYYSKYVQPKGFYIESSISFLFGKASEFNNSRVGVAIGATANYQLNSHLSVGAGIEPTAILETNQMFLIPIYSHFKFNIMERKVAPVLICDVGWSFVTNNKDESDFSHKDGGWYARPAVGLQAGNFILSIGYQLQQITTTKNNNWWGGWNSTDSITIEERQMKNITISGSIKF